MNIAQSESTAQDIAINKIYDVVVVGAGPIGLATAVGLRKRGINNILVLDQTSAFRQVGQTVDLLPNGLKALRYLDPEAYEAVKKASLTFGNFQQSNNEKTQKKPPLASQEWAIKNFEGQKVRSISLDFGVWLQKYGEGRVSISWYTLQTTLRQLLLEDQVKPNHRCINVVDEPDYGYVQLDCVCNASSESNPYAHWVGLSNNETQSQNSNSDPQPSVTKSFRAKLIVAADGINSTLRRILYAGSSNQAFAVPEYSGFAAIYCTEIPGISDELRSHLEEKFFAGSPIATVSNDEHTRDTERALSESPRMLLIARPSIRYVVHLPIPLDSLQGKSGSDLLDFTLQELDKAGFPDELKELVQLSPSENIQQRPYYIHRAKISEHAWSAGRIVLVGDAAHGMPPFMAQGANQGFEDAMVLTTLIADIAKENDWDNKPAIVSAFERYERFRRPFMEYIQQATLTLFPHSSNQALEEYSQKVYSRNFDEVVATPNS